MPRGEIARKFAVFTGYRPRAGPSVFQVRSSGVTTMQIKAIGTLRTTIIERISIAPRLNKKQALLFPAVSFCSIIA